MATFFFSESSLGNSLHFYRAAKNKGLKRRNYLDNRFTPHHEFEPKSSLPESQVNLESLKISPLFLLLSFFLLFSFRYLCQSDHGIRNTRTFTFKLKRFSRPFARVYSALIHSCVQKKLTFQKCGGQISFLCKTFVLSEWSCHFHLFKIFEASQSCRAMLHNVWTTLCLVGSPSSIFCSLSISCGYHRGFNISWLWNVL